MTKAEEIQLFQQLASNPRLLDWLRGQRDAQITVLCKAVDPVAIARAQGQIQFLDTAIELLQKAPHLSTR